MTLYYLAHPYTNDPVRNIEKCKVIAAKLFVKGYKFYAPILMTHPIHETAHILGLYEGEYWEEWMAFDQEYLPKCEALILCPGWEDSDGCKQERLYFLYNHKPVLELDEILKKEE